MTSINKKGVTLIELIIVMVIIAIGATLLVPAIGAWIPQYRLRSAARDIVSTMRTAQMRAVSSNLEYRVSFTTGNPNSIVLQRNSGGWSNDGAPQTLPTGVEVTPSIQNFLFNPNSTASSGNVILRIYKGGQVMAERTIRVSGTTGRIRIE